VLQTVEEHVKIKAHKIVSDDYVWIRVPDVSKQIIQQHTLRHQLDNLHSALLDLVIEHWRKWDAIKLANEDLFGDNLLVVFHGIIYSN
jgi:hypothetical protein